MSKTDIGVPEPDAVVFEENGALKGAVDYSRAIALDAHDWYARERKWKRFFAKTLRLLAILTAAVGGIIPILSQIGQPADWYYLSPGWSGVSLAAAGTLILFDRFFGFSTGWLRFTNAMTQIRIAIQDFDMGLTEIRLGCAEPGPEKGESCSVFVLCRNLISKVNRIVMDETLKWDDEFRKAIQKVDEAAKKEGGGKQNHAR